MTRPFRAPMSDTLEQRPTTTLDYPRAATLGRPGPRGITRILFTLGDQGMVSVATFATGWFVNRLGGEEAGLYFMAGSLWILVLEAHNSLVSNPHMLRVPHLAGRALRRFNGATLLHQMGLSVLLSVLMGVAALGAVLIGQPSLALLLACVTVSVLPVALRNYARNYCFATRRSTTAFVLDAGVSALQVSLVAVLSLYQQLSAQSAILVVALANLTSTGMWLYVCRSQFAPSFAVAARYLPHTWKSGRWMFLSTTIWVAGLNLYPWFVYALASKSQAGLLGVGQWLAQLTSPLMMAMQNYLGPSIAHAHAERDAPGFRRYVTLATLATVALTLPLAVVLWITAEHLLQFFYPDQYGGTGNIAGLLAFALVAQVAGFCPSRGLFSLGRARVDMLTNLAPIGLLLTVGVWAIQLNGAFGGAVALLTSQTVGFVIRFAAFLKCSGRRIE